MSNITLPTRIASIDILRALTMVLMIFVNDLWSLSEIPEWLEHVDRGVDGIGLADVVFPAFLFIVGLSLPFAIDARRSHGDNDRELTLHIISRSFALLVMGVYLVNGESFNAEATGMARYWWNPVCCLCFILIWNSYPKQTSPYLVWSLRIAAIITLVIFAFIYRGGEDDSVQRFGTHWWGILGLIGWAYLVSALVTMFAKNNIRIVMAAWAFFAVLSILSHAELLPPWLNFIPHAILGGTLTGLTMGGVLATLIFRHYREANNNKMLTAMLLAFAVILVLLSMITRPYWGLAKLGATPAWLFLCSAFTVIAFIAIYWIADVWGKAAWFNFVKPAGTNTLLCYLIPYFAYASTRVMGVHLPDVLLVGSIGLIKSIAFALLCVLITGGLTKAGVRLRL
jgi:predicted acyltransferase